MGSRTYRSLALLLAVYLPAAAVERGFYYFTRRTTGKLSCKTIGEGNYLIEFDFKDPDGVRELKLLDDNVLIYSTRSCAERHPPSEERMSFLFNEPVTHAFVRDNDGNITRFDSE